MDPDRGGMFRFNTQGGLVLTLKRSEGGSWTDVYKEEAGVNEGTFFVTGGPASEIEFHIVADENSQKYSTRIDDGTYKNDDEYPLTVTAEDSLDKECAMLIFCRDHDVDEVMEIINTTLGPDIIKEELPDGCYAVTVQDAK